MYRDILITSGFFVICYQAVLTYLLLKKMSNRHECKCVVKEVEKPKKSDYGNILKRRQKFKSDAGWYEHEKKQREREQD